MPVSQVSENSPSALLIQTARSADYLQAVSRYSSPQSSSPSSTFDATLSALRESRFAKRDASQHRETTETPSTSESKSESKTTTKAHKQDSAKKHDSKHSSHKSKRQTSTSQEDASAAPSDASDSVDFHEPSAQSPAAASDPSDQSEADKDPSATHNPDSPAPTASETPTLAAPAAPSPLPATPGDAPVPTSPTAETAENPSAPAPVRAAHAPSHTAQPAKDATQGDSSEGNDADSSFKRVSVPRQEIPIHPVQQKPPLPHFKLQAQSTSDAPDAPSSGQSPSADSPAPDFVPQFATAAAQIQSTSAAQIPVLAKAEVAISPNFSSVNSIFGTAHNRLSESADVAPAAQDPLRPETPDPMEQIVLGLKDKLDIRTGKAEISLEPPNLGAVKVSVSLENGTLTAEFQSASNVVRDLLKGNLEKLKTVLESQGVAVDRLAVAAPQDADPRAGAQPQGQNSFGSPTHDGRSAGQYQQDPRPGQRQSDAFARVIRTVQKAPIDLVA